MLTSIRTGEPCPDSISGLWKEGLATRLDLQPLSEQEVGKLAGNALGGHPDPATLRAAELSDVRVLAVDRSVMTKMVSGLLYPPLHARTSVNRSLPPGRLRPAAAPENVDAYGEGSDRSARGR